MIMFDRPFGPQFSMAHKSISSVDICWLIFSMLIVMVRWGMLKKASWLKNRFCLLSFFSLR